MERNKMYVRKTYKILLLAMALCLPVKVEAALYDLTIVGPVKWKDGLGRISIGIADTLKDKLTINHIPSAFWYADDVPDQMKHIFLGQDKTAGKVAILTAPLCWRSHAYADDVPNNALIKIAYSMLESTAIPQLWVSILNEKFDCVVVPDLYYVEVYRNSGVTIPIFALPHGIYCDHLLSGKTFNKKRSGVFTFGFTGQYHPRKNQDLIIEAFHGEFKNDSKVRLRLHGRPGGLKEYIRGLHKKIRQLDAQTIELLESEASDEETVEFFSSLDCYILLSRGEGFSVTPREALAMGIPCILSNNTAHKTICETGYVYGVPSNIPVLADYGNLFGKAHCGYNFNCELQDARKAMREVYNNYALYKEKAMASKAWVETFLWKNLKPKFMNLVKPSLVLLGDRNVVTDQYLMTNSQKLYKKYCQLAASNAAE